MAGMQAVVVVTFDYRSDILGFPRAGELKEGERNLGMVLFSCIPFHFISYLMRRECSSLRSGRVGITD